MEKISRKNFLKTTLASAAGLAAAGLATGCSKADAPASGTAAGGAVAFADTVSWNAEYDAVVIGFGGAGGIAAVDMADAGLNVLVLEKAPYGHEGGNTRYCSQRFLYLDPANKAQMTTYMKQVRGLYDNMSDEVVDYLVEGFTHTLEYYEYLGAKDYELRNDAEFPMFDGSDVVVKVYTMNNGGKGFWPVVREAVVGREDKIKVWYDSAAKHLVQDPDTRAILGVQVEHDGQTYNVHAKKGVVLACGGFEANNTMVQDYLQLPYAIPLGSPYNTGDGVTMGLEAGADLWHMSALSGPFLEFQNPDTTIPFRQLMGTLSYSTLKDTSAIIVGADGTRFVDETVNLKHGHVMYHGMFIRVPMSLPAYVVFDEQARLLKPLYRVWSEGMEKEIEKGWIIKADTLEELAEKIQVPAENLVNEISTYNSYCANGKDIQFDRPAEYLHAFGAGPYYAMSVVPAMINTQGGPTRNIDCEVLAPNGDAIPNLYSVGELGSFYSSKYQGAGNLAECIITGRTAAAKVVANEYEPKAVVYQAADAGESVDFTTPNKTFETEANEYIGIGYGINRIVVKVKVNGGKIESINFVEINETPGICDAALTLPQKIVETQSLDVDAISGATRTSQGVLDAVKDALAQAGIE